MQIRVLLRKPITEDFAAKDVVEVWSGEEVTAQAQPAEGEEFYAWWQNGKIVSTNANYTFTAVSDVTLTAVFDPIYTVSFDSGRRHAGRIAAGYPRRDGLQPRRAHAPVCTRSKAGIWTARSMISASPFCPT